MEFPSLKTVLTVSTIAVVAVAATVYLTTSSDNPPTRKPRESGGKKKRNHRPRKKSTNLSDSAISSDLDPDATPESQAKEAKAKGNSLFAEKQYEEAVKSYTKAIELDAQAVYYNNRAACHVHLKEYKEAIEDCNEALKRDPLYIKALNRRAISHEIIGQSQLALNDFSALCVLEEFKNQATITNADRVLKYVGEALARAQMSNKKEYLPSASFITAYLESFSQTSSRLQELLNTPVETVADGLLHEGLVLIAGKEDYKKAMEKIEESLQNSGENAEVVIEGEDVFSSVALEGVALNLRGTFRFLVGNLVGAMSDFETSIAVSKSLDAYIKRASVFMEMGNAERAIEEFELAGAQQDGSGDFYYHRGQVKHLTGDIKGSVGDFRQALELDPSLVYAQIQLGVAIYKDGDVEGALAAFNSAQESFPDRAEVLNYKGEIYLDQGRHEKAMRCFDKSIEMYPHSSLPYINKVKNDPVTAETLLKKAIDLDPLSDIAYGPLAQLYLTQNRVEEAIEIYNRAIEFARTEQELCAGFCCREAAAAQLNIKESYPEIYSRLIAAQMAMMRQQQMQGQ